MVQSSDIIPIVNALRARGLLSIICFTPFLCSTNKTGPSLELTSFGCKCLIIVVIRRSALDMVR